MSNKALPRIMGIVNVTPDSFSDGGKYLYVNAAIDHALTLREEGADIIDVGGESTRPGASPVDTAEEIARVVPVISALAKENIPISIDTRHTAVMRAAIDAGACFLNDVNALRDEGAIEFAAQSGAELCLMHMQGDPQCMQANPHYEDVVVEVKDFLRQRIDACLHAGIAQDKIYADIGIGFGKNLSHNIDLLKNIDVFHDLGVRQLLGVSRKKFIAQIAGEAPADDRLGGSMAAAIWGQTKDVAILRVHDVAQTVQAFKVWRALSS